MNNYFRLGTEGMMLCLMIPFLIILGIIMLPFYLIGLIAERVNT